MRGRSLAETGTGGHCTADLLIRLMPMHKHTAHEFAYDDSQLHDQFLREVFKNWASNYRQQPFPKFLETSIQVGMLEVNNPEPNTTRRRVNQPEDHGNHLGHITYADTNVTQHRRHNSPIVDESDLTTEEKLALMDLLKGYMTMHGRRTVNPRRRELYQEFFNVIFNQWDSIEGPEDPPVLNGPNFSHTTVRAGKLIVSHPDPQPAQRTGQMDMASGDGPILPPLGPEPEPGNPRSAARRAGQPVFLDWTLKLEEESYGWLWRDKKGKFVNPKYVEITPELGKGEVRERAIKNYDI